MCGHGVIMCPSRRNVLNTRSRFNYIHSRDIAWKRAQYIHILMPKRKALLIMIRRRATDGWELAMRHVRGLIYLLILNRQNVDTAAVLMRSNCDTEQNLMQETKKERNRCVLSNCLIVLSWNVRGRFKWRWATRHVKITNGQTTNIKEEVDEDDCERTRDTNHTLTHCQLFPRPSISSFYPSIVETSISQFTVFKETQTTKKCNIAFNKH